MGLFFLYMYNSVNLTNVDLSSTFRFVGKGSVQEEKHNCESLYRVPKGSSIPLDCSQCPMC